MSVRKLPDTVKVGTPEEAPVDSLKEACQGLLNAIDRRDAGAVADALREIVGMVDDDSNDMDDDSSLDEQG